MNSLGIKRKDLYGKSSDCGMCSPEESKEKYDNEEVYPEIRVGNAAHAKALGLHLLKAGKTYDLKIQVRRGDVHINDKGEPTDGYLKILAIDKFEAEPDDDDAPSVVKALRSRKQT